MRMMTKLFLISAQFSFLNVEGLQQQLTWYEAHNNCSETGGKLPTGVRVISSEEPFCGNLPSAQAKEYWIGDITVLSEFISVEGCFENIDQFNTHRNGSVPFEECYQMCKGSFLYRFEDNPLCFCIANKYFPDNTNIKHCYTENEKTQWWLFGYEYKTLGMFGSCPPCSKTPHRPVCIIKKILQAHEVNAVDGMYFCSQDGNREIGLFRQKFITSAYHDSTYKLDNIIQCGFIHCDSSGQNFRNVQYKNCSSNASYFCNPDKVEPTKPFEISFNRLTTDSLTVSLVNLGSNTTQVSKGITTEASEQIVPGMKLTHTTESVTGVTTVSVAQSSNIQTTVISAVDKSSLSSSTRSKVSEQTVPGMKFTNERERITVIPTGSIAHTAYTPSTVTSSKDKSSLSSRTHAEERVSTGMTTNSESLLENNISTKEQQSTATSIKPNSKEGSKTKTDGSKKSNITEVSEQTVPGMKFTHKTESVTGVITVSVAQSSNIQSTEITTVDKSSLSSSTRAKERVSTGMTTNNISTKEQQSTAAPIKPNSKEGFETKTDGSKKSNITGPVVGSILGVVLIVCLTIIAICKYRKTGFFRKKWNAYESKEMNGVSHKYADLSEDHDIVPNSNNRGENGIFGIDNEGIKHKASLEIKTETTPNNVSAVVSKTHTPKSNTFEFAERDSQHGDTKGKYDILNNPLDRGENQPQHNVYDSCQGIRSDSDPTYNTTYSQRVDIPNDDAMYDHTFNVVKM